MHNGSWGNETEFQPPQSGGYFLDCSKPSKRAQGKVNVGRSFQPANQGNERGKDNRAGRQQDSGFQEKPPRHYWRCNWCDLENCG